MRRVDGHTRRSRPGVLRPLSGSHCRDHEEYTMTGVNLPKASLDRALRRVDSIWGPEAAPHHLMYGQTGSGKTTLIKALLDLCPFERVLTLDPKSHADPAWDGPADDPDRWGAPIIDVPERFGFQGERGGGPHGLWFRLIGTPDRPDTARRFSAALRIVQDEGHCILVLDDAREICRQLKLAGQVDSVMNLGRSANVLAIL